MNKKVFKLFKDKSKQDPHLKHFSDDRILDNCLRKFKVQNEEMKNLRKNFNEFLSEIKNLTFTVENMYICFKNIFEPDWYGNAEFHQSCQKSLNLWRNFIDEIQNGVQVDLESYSSKFPEMKRSIEKYNKKNSDFQKQKKFYESCVNGKRIDPGKVKKAELELKNIQDQFTDCNNLLKKDLPIFCDNRIPSYINLWSSLFSAEDKLFQCLQAERKAQLKILSQLNEYVNTGKYNVLNQATTNQNHYPPYSRGKATSVASLFTPEKWPLETTLIKGNSVWNITSDDGIYDHISVPNRDDNSLLRTQSYHIGSKSNSQNFESNDDNSIPNSKGRGDTIQKKLSFNNEYNGSQILNKYQNVTLKSSPSISFHDNSDFDLAEDNLIYAKLNKNNKQPVVHKESPTNSDRSDNRKSNNKTVSITLNSIDNYRKAQPPKCYYQVVAKYNYFSQDEDELNLKKDDIIMVLPWESEEQQEDGWLYGENTITKEKGLFPENHTTPHN